MMTDFPVKFKGANAGQVDTGRLRTSNLEVAGSIPDSSIFSPYRVATVYFNGKSVIILGSFYGNHLI